MRHEKMETKVRFLTEFCSLLSKWPSSKLAHDAVSNAVALGVRVPPWTPIKLHAPDGTASRLHRDKTVFDSLMEYQLRSAVSANGARPGSLVQR